jgi:4'-phosphopantetheinyl transferase
MMWQKPGPDIDLGRDQIHVWRAKLDRSLEEARSALPCLAEDERTRAMRFHFDNHRRDFIVARTFLRSVLARYLGQNRAQIKFEYSRYGKPAIAASGRGSPFFFNLTHSHQLALLALTARAEIGIDVEFIRAIDEGIAERYFSRSEVAALRALPPDLQNEAFFNCWTRKEAYIKARGEGLSLALDEFDVSLAPGAPAAILAVRKGEEASRWRLAHLQPAPGYVGALAIRAPKTELKFWDWEWPDAGT